MLLYTDIITGDELVSDAFPMKLVDDIVYEVDCQMIRAGDLVSAEDVEGEETDNAVNNVVHHFKLQPTAFDRNGYLTYLKRYMKAVKNALAESGVGTAEVTAFEKGASDHAKKIVANLKDYQFYTGESRDLDGMVGLLNYRQDGVTPYFTFWKHGLKEQAV